MTTITPTRRLSRATAPLLACGLLAGGFTGIAVADQRQGPQRGAPFAQLTDAQRTCLTDRGLARPSGPPTTAQRQALREGLKACGVTVAVGPAREGKAQGQARMKARFARLTDAQRECLTSKGVSRPTGKPTPETFTALRDAAKACGIEIPAGARR